MSFLLAEVPAAAPAAGAAATLTAVTTFVVVVVLAVLWFQIARKILVRIAGLHILTVHPFRWMNGPIASVDHWIRDAQAGTERAVVWSFHATMWSISTSYKQTRDLAEAVYHSFQSRPNDKLGAVGANEPASITPRIKRLEREYKGIESEIKQLERREHAKRAAGAAAGSIDEARLQRGIDRLNARLGHVERELHGIEHGQAVEGTKTGAKTGAKVTTAPRVVPRTRAHANKWTDVLTHKGLVSVAIASLAAVGLSWLRCPSLLRMGKKLGCGGFSRLEPFLATTFEALAVLDLCQFAVATQALARAIVPQLGAVLLVQDAVCLGGGASVGSAMNTPSVSTKIALPSGLLETEA